MNFQQNQLEIRPDFKVVNLLMKALSKKNEFLHNISNKKESIKFLCTMFQKQGTQAIQIDGDADMLLVKTAIQKAHSGNRVTIAANDNDVLILPLHFRKD